MLKKTSFSFVLILMFFISFSFFSDAFSETDIRFRVVKKGEEVFIRILTPVDVKKINGEIYSKKNELKAAINKDSYGVVKEYGNTFNEFIISSEDIRFNEDDKLKININNNYIRENISAVPFKTIEQENLEKERQLNIMTYNIKHGRNDYGMSTLNEIKNLIEKENIDIVGLQELDKYMIRTVFEDQIRRLAYELDMYFVYGANKKILNGKYGNGILSKYPIADWENIKMPGKESRGLLKASLWIDGKRMNFMVTHLGLDKDTRDKQFDVVESYVGMYKDNLILVGDLNTLQNDPNIINLEHKVQDAATKTLKRSENTIQRSKKNKRIDYIFTSKKYTVESYKVLNVNYSDHYPVISTVKLK